MKDKRMPTQTTPKGLEIPVPKRADVMADLGKVAGTEPRRSGHTKWSEIKRKKGVPPSEGGTAE